MNSLLNRASGYDVANLWMNLAKVLILFLFIYQETLYTQLGLNMFKQIYYVFYLKEASESPPLSAPAAETAGRDGSPIPSAPVQALTPESPNFNIGFLPLSISTHYDGIRVEILQVEKDQPEGLERLRLDEQAERYREYAWPGRREREKETPLHLALFNLRELVKDPLTTGTYRVRFGVRFFRDGKPVYQEGYGADSAGEGDERSVWLRYHHPSELRYGDFPVIHGQWFEIPSDLKNREFLLTEWRSRGTQKTSEAWSDWAPGRLIETQNGRFHPLAVSSGNTYEQKGYFQEKDSRVDFTVIFIVLENQSPRSTYLGPGEKDVYFVKLFSDYLFDGPGYQYFNLSQHIIDPDGKNAAADTDVRVRRMDNLRAPGGHYSLLPAQDGSGDFWLRVHGNMERIIARVGDSEEVTVTAHDEINRQNIKIRVVRAR